MGILLVFFVLAFNLAAFLLFPASGPLGPIIAGASVAIWTLVAVKLERGTVSAGPLGRAVLGLLFAAAAAVSALAFLPQTDGRCPLVKLNSGFRPDGRDLYLGLRRIGVDAPRLLPKAPPEQPI